MVNKSTLDWSLPVLDRAISLLTRGWQSGPLDLSGQMIVVPSSQAGRRWRERLADVTSQRDGCVLLALVVTPSELFRPGPSDKPLADPIITVLLAWREALKQATQADVAGFLPGGAMPGWSWRSNESSFGSSGIIAKG